MPRPCCGVEGSWGWEGVTRKGFWDGGPGAPGSEETKTGKEKKFFLNLKI